MTDYPASMGITTSSPITFEFYRGSGDHRVDYLIPLTIRTGLDSIKWSYNLNTATTPTLGGQVTQILGCMIGPMTIGGMSSTAKQLQGIYSWFRDYMTLAGLQPDGGRSTRIQTPVRVTYAARNWVFWLKPTMLDGFKFETGNIATPWSITGEVAGWTGENQMSVADPLKVETMRVLDGTAALGKALGDHTVTLQTFANVGFEAQSPYIDPHAPTNLDSGINNFGNNFQRLIASLATGQFNLTTPFDATATPGAQFKEAADAVYEGYLGTNLVAGGTDNSSGGSTTSGSVSASSPESDIAQAIASAFEAAQIPGALGVTVSLLETTSLRPGAYEGTGVSGEGIGLYQDSSGGAEHNTPEWKAAHASVAGKPAGDYPSITDKYPASLQIANAVARFKGGKPAGISYNDSTSIDKMAQWAFNVQVGQGYTVGDSHTGAATSLFQGKWDEAVKLINAGPSASSAGSITATGDALVKLVLSYYKSDGSGLFMGVDGGVGSDNWLDIINYQSRGVQAATLQGMAALMAANWSLHVGAVKAAHHKYTTNGGISSHWYGIAADFNNYGTEGAFSNSGHGTSNPDPSALIAYVKANRAALGNAYTGYTDSGGNHGSDFSDNATSLHITFGRDA